MSGWAQKRFWKDVTVEPAEAGHTIALDGRPLRTPGKAALVMPTVALADAVAEEWAAQEGTIDPGRMPMTRIANSAIDKVRPQHRDVADLLVAYGETDLLCYRAEGPPALIARQAEGWDPWLNWAAVTFGARLTVGQGIVPMEQPADAVAGLRSAVVAMDAFGLTAFHDLVALSGSLVLALAVQRRALDPDVGWRLSRIDETWQIENWGRDEDAAEAAEIKRRAFLDAARFGALLGDG